MKERYKIVYQGGEGEIVEKKSRFIAEIRPVESEEEATAFIAEVKKKYWDARHHCSAFTIGENNEVARCSDDGEPAQTAGRPMLDVLLGRELHNVCAVVTRYFGGTLLGTGGLVRAYGGAVQEGLKKLCGSGKMPGSQMEGRDRLQRAWKGAVHFGRSRAADSGQRVRRGRGSDDPGAV